MNDPVFQVLAINVSHLNQNLMKLNEVLVSIDAHLSRNDHPAEWHSNGTIGVSLTKQDGV